MYPPSWSSRFTCIVLEVLSKQKRGVSSYKIKGSFDSGQYWDGALGWIDLLSSELLQLIPKAFVRQVVEWFSLFLSVYHREARNTEYLSI